MCDIDKMQALGRQYARTKTPALQVSRIMRYSGYDQLHFVCLVTIIWLGVCTGTVVAFGASWDKASSLGAAAQMWSVSSCGVCVCVCVCVCVWCADVRRCACVRVCVCVHI